MIEIQRYPVHSNFEQAYLKVRELEQRILGLDEIRLLPEINGHPLASEWEHRKRSTQRLIGHLQRKKDPVILDVGCGNGWFLQKITPFAKHVTGIDVNITELTQASELLEKETNVELIYGDLFQVDFTHSYDGILLNACVQYFENFQALIKKLKSMLSPEGEIHILDSPFYASPKEAEAAHQRSVNYYLSKGVAEMSEHYHHHLYSDLLTFEHQLLYSPQSILNKIRRKLSKDSPFPWIKIT